jgi:hypothetical protein
VNTWAVDPGEEFLTKNDRWLMPNNPGKEQCWMPLMQDKRCQLVLNHACAHMVWVNREPPEHLK